MKKVLIPIILLIFAENVFAYSIELGLDEVLLVDNSTVTFDPSPTGDLIYLRVEGPNGITSSVLSFGESIFSNGVNYTLGHFDPTTQKLVLHLSGNYSQVKVMKKKDFSVNIVEAFDTYTKFRIRWEGYYDINDTLKVYSNGLLIKEVPISLKNGDEITFKVKTPPSGIFTLSLGELSKNVIVGEITKQVEIKSLWRDDKLHIVLFNHGDGVNVTVALTSGGFTLEKEEVYLGRKEEREVTFRRNPLQGVVVVNYGSVLQESFYFEPPSISVISYSFNGKTLRLKIKNEGGYFHGRVSITSNSLIISSPLYLDLTLHKGEMKEVTFNLNKDVEYVTIRVSSRDFTTTIPLMLEKNFSVRFVNDYARAPLGGAAAYSLVITGKGRVELDVTGLPDSIRYAFYYNQNEVKTLNIEGGAQLTLVVSLPSFPSGFSVESPLRFNVTINGKNYPLTLEVSGAGKLPVYGDNWLAKSNFSSEIHYLGLPYHVVWRDITPPYIFENIAGEKIAFLYGRYVRQGKDLKLHVLDPSGLILHTSEAPKGRPDFVIFNESKFMLMVEGKGIFDAVLLVAHYIKDPQNITLNLKRKPFGEGLEVIILNATQLRGKKLHIITTSGKSIELKAYHFTLNSEKEDFDPFGTGKAIFTARGNNISRTIAIRNDEDFIAIVIIGEGQVNLSFKVSGTSMSTAEITTRWSYIVVMVLGVLLVLSIFLEKRLA
ncbi:hypothetical protein DRN82_00480 [Thermococci archaeon]|nr:MAG: hypothetical protein DRN82_00480 [Thermococci archaeon]